jgi:hypothetical protein
LLGDDDGVLPLVPLVLPVVPVPRLPVVPMVLPEPVVEPEGEDAPVEVVGSLPVPLTVPEADRLVLLLAVVLGVVVEAVVSLGVVAEGVATPAPGAVVLLVVVALVSALRSQPVAAAAARASTAMAGMSFFMTSPVQVSIGGNGRPRGACTSSGYTHDTCQCASLWEQSEGAARSFRRAENLRGGRQA